MPPTQAHAIQAISQLQQQLQSLLDATSADELPTPLPHESLKFPDDCTPSLPPSFPDSTYGLTHPPAAAKVYVKRLSASDTAVHGSLSLPQKVALNCLPSLVSDRRSW